MQPHSAVRVQTEEEKATKVGFGRLLALSRPQWPFLVVGAITSALLGGIYPVFALILSSLTVALEPSKPRSEATKYAIVFFGIGVAQLVLGSLQSFVYAVAGARLARRARLLFFKAVLSQEIGWCGVRFTAHALDPSHAAVATD